MIWFNDGRYGEFGWFVHDHFRLCCEIENSREFMNRTGLEIKWNQGNLELG
jgi:hypothetical protein